MTIRENLSELRESLDELQKKLGETAAEFAADESVGPRISALKAKASAVQEKLPAAEGSVWDAVKHEVRHDIDALMQDFAHMVGYIDEHYREKE